MGSGHIFLYKYTFFERTIFKSELHQLLYTHRTFLTDTKPVSKSQAINSDINLNSHQFAYNYYKLIK